MPKFGPNKPHLVPNLTYCHFLTSGLLIYPKIAWHDTMMMQEVFGTQIWVKAANVGPEIICFTIFSSFLHQLSFKLPRTIGSSNVLLLAEVKLVKKIAWPKFGLNEPKLGPKLVFHFIILSSLNHQLFFKLYSITAWKNVQVLVEIKLTQKCLRAQTWVKRTKIRHKLMLLVIFSSLVH